MQTKTQHTGISKASNPMQDHKDVMLDHITTMLDAADVAQDPNVSRSERDRMVRELTVDLYNLKYYISVEVV